MTRRIVAYRDRGPGLYWQLAANGQVIPNLNESEALWTLFLLMVGLPSQFRAHGVLPQQEPAFTVSLHSHHFWTIRSGDRYQEDLCADEAAGLAARLLGGADPKRWLRTEEEHRRDHYAMFPPTILLESWQRFLPVYCPKLLPARPVSV